MVFTPDPRLVNTVTKNITIQFGDYRQEFKDFGLSQGSSTQNIKSSMGECYEDAFNATYKDLGVSIFRMFFTIDSKLSIEQLATSLIKRYNSSGFIDDLKNIGVSKFLLSPGMKLPPNTYTLSNPSEYVEKLCNLIIECKNRGFEITHTSFWNEPGFRHWSGLYNPIIKQMRSLLPADVKIVVPEPSNCDGFFFNALKKMRSDKESWNAIDAIACHSYGLPLTHPVYGSCIGKPVWQTESGFNGNEVEFIYPIINATRIINDISCGAECWLYFFGMTGSSRGYRLDDSTKLRDPDNSTKLLWLSDDKKSLDIGKKYRLLKLILDALPKGSRIRHCTYLDDKNVIRPFRMNGGHISFLQALKPDGKISLFIANPTGYSTTYGQKSLVKVSMEIPELKTAPPTQFKLTSAVNKNGNIGITAKVVTAINGSLSIDAVPMSFYCFEQV